MSIIEADEHIQEWLVLGKHDPALQKLIIEIGDALDRDKRRQIKMSREKKALRARKRVVWG